MKREPALELYAELAGTEQRLRIALAQIDELVNELSNRQAARLLEEFQEITWGDTGGLG